MKRTSNEQSLKELLKEMLGNKKLKHGITHSKLQTFWQERMGATIVKHTTMVKLNKKKLMVKVDSDALRQELFQSKSIIIDLVNKHFKEELINDVHLL